MPPQTASSCRREEGTASIELVAVLPFLLLAVMVAAQIGLTGQALWSAAVAARAGARAAVVGRETEAAARRALPVSMRAGAEVRAGDPVSVRIVVPRLLPGFPRFRVGAESGLGDVGG